MIGAIQNSEHTFFGKIPKNKHFKYVPNFFPQIFSLANFFQIPGSGSKLGNTLIKFQKKKKKKQTKQKTCEGCVPIRVFPSSLFPLRIPKQGRSQNRDLQTIFLKGK